MNQDVIDYIDRITQNDETLTEIVLTELALNDNDVAPLINALAKNTIAAKRITIIELTENQLTSIDLSDLTALEEIYLNENQLTSIGLSKLTVLRILSLSENQLKSLNLSDLISLEEIYLDGNQLKSLNISKLIYLKDIYMNSNQLESLKVSGLTVLEELSLEHNKLKYLDVSNLPVLKQLHLNYNELTSLNVSELTSLEELSIDNNKLKLLDASSLSALTRLEIYGNHLTDAGIMALNATKLILTNTNIINNNQDSNEINLTSDIIKQHCMAVLNDIVHTHAQTYFNYALVLDSLLPSDIASHTLGFISPLAQVERDIANFENIFNKLQDNTETQSGDIQRQLEIINEFKKTELPKLLTKIDGYHYGLTHSKSLQRVSALNHFFNENGFYWKEPSSTSIKTDERALYTPLAWANKVKRDLATTKKKAMKVEKYLPPLRKRLLLQLFRPCY